MPDIKKNILIASQLKMAINLIAKIRSLGNEKVDSDMATKISLFQILFSIWCLNLGEMLDYGNHNCSYTVKSVSVWSKTASQCIV